MTHSDLISDLIMEDSIVLFTDTVRTENSLNDQHIIKNRYIDNNTVDSL